MRSLRLLVVALLLLPLVVVVGFLPVFTFTCVFAFRYTFFFSALFFVVVVVVLNFVYSRFFNLCFVSLIRYRISQNLLCFPRFLLLLSLIKISHLIRFSIFL